MGHLGVIQPLFEVHLNFPDNQLDKIPLLKIVKKIEKILVNFKPNIIFTHFENCLNIDHQIAYKATITACRPLKKSSVEKILSFEICDSFFSNLLEVLCSHNFELLKFRNLKI